MNKIIFSGSYYFTSAVRFLFSVINGGEHCVVCGRTTFGIPVCKICNSTYFSVQGNLEIKRCKCCGKELISEDEFCMECRENPVIHHSDFTFSLFSYRLWNKELLFLWKIQNQRSLSVFFAKKMNEVLTWRKIEFIVPVPPRKGKIKKNGWDQIDELCQFLQFFYGFKILKILQRKSSTQQKTLDRSARLATVENAYGQEDSEKIKKLLKPFHGIFPEKVALIDDVSTTGATIECCSKILKEMGVRQVEVFTLFGVD